jgi:hypothetical protein
LWNFLLLLIPGSSALLSFANAIPGIILGFITTIGLGYLFYLERNRMPEGRDI